ALFFFAHGSFEASERKRSLTNDSFRASLDDPFRQRRQVSRPIRTVSEPVSLEISPIPTTFTGSQWLPAKHLILEDAGLDSQSPVTAGKPLTRRIMLIADGLMASQLPSITQKVPEGIKPYEERPQLTDTPRKSGISSSRLACHHADTNSIRALYAPTH
ncbi:MAG: BatD family protein, partial [Candidatus Thiodiazotropha sp. (ex Gloverina cf. vestifex)]|nr:BatD family protein [Candidatus Thiodiazotropha sp. (ex Gloverina cf. vestifex)]